MCNLTHLGQRFSVFERACSRASCFDTLILLGVGGSESTVHVFQTILPARVKHHLVRFESQFPCLPERRGEVRETLPGWGCHNKMGNLAHAARGGSRYTSPRRSSCLPRLAPVWLAAEPMGTRPRKKGQYELIQCMASCRSVVVTRLSLFRTQLCEYTQWIDTHFWLHLSCLYYVLSGEILPGTCSLTDAA